MSYFIELLDGEGRVVARPPGLLTLAVPFIRHILGDRFSGSKVLLILYAIPESGNDLPGDPYLTYASTGIGYAALTVVNAGRIIYRHPHTIGEIVAQGIRQWLATLAEASTITGYRLTGPTIEVLYDRATPAVAGVAEFEPYAAGERPAFRIRPLPPPVPEVRSLASLRGQVIAADWLTPGRTDFVKVLVDEPVHDDLTRTHLFSSDVEEGGFLIGQVYEDATQPGTFLAHVTAALPARHTGASLLHFTFTGDSFDHVKRTIDRKHPGTQMLGWYHTHLFTATDDIGLSTIDFRLHFTTFRLPWQIAGLVNLDGQQRVLRFYVRQHDTMALCPHQAITEGA